MVHVLYACYLAAAVFFIFALRGLSSPGAARKGNIYGMAGMAAAVFATLFEPGMTKYFWPLVAVAVGGAIGIVMARRAKMTELPQMIALFNGFVGLGAVLLAFTALIDPASSGLEKTLSGLSKVEIAAGLIIGGVTFSGSMVAFMKLQGLWKRSWLLPNHRMVNALTIVALVLISLLFIKTGSLFLLAVMALLSFSLGVTGVMMIGGADMPVVISVLNCYSGFAAVGIGFIMSNALLIITGALVGASGAILSYLMCQAMNRSLANVILGGFGAETGGSADSGDTKEERAVKQFYPEDAAFLLKSASTVVIVPGYGMAVAQAQHAIAEMAGKLEKEGVKVVYGVHPVAGRMPGHMNVLLAEANVPYEDVLELDEVNRLLPTADVALVIGANDVTNPLAKTDPKSPIYGMPVIDVEKARTVLFVKRSMATGYSGVDNPLFFADNTYMLFGDAKKVAEGLVKSMG